MNYFHILNPVHYNQFQEEWQEGRSAFLPQPGWLIERTRIAMAESAVAEAELVVSEEIDDA